VDSEIYLTKNVKDESYELNHDTNIITDIYGEKTYLLERELHKVLGSVFACVNGNGMNEVNEYKELIQLLTLATLNAVELDNLQFPAV
jgi:hypothetical protein